jgi:hypothetical protein
VELAVGRLMFTISLISQVHLYMVDNSSSHTIIEYCPDLEACARSHSTADLYGRERQREGRSSDTDRVIDTTIWHFTYKTCCSVELLVMAVEYILVLLNSARF